ncbi:DUF3152 domain-containing protein [Longispora sp. K20-0274]|uniref:DUF3152 domain-containing protein n=1 Tax=Longispora sp. K20-0274 TaxID=3088255 RepID=UPI00399A5EA5
MLPVALAVGVAVMLLGGAGHAVFPAAEGRSTVAAPPIDRPPAVGTEPDTAALRPVSYPPRGAGTFRGLPGDGARLGPSGTLLRFQVVVENGIGNLEPATVAGVVEAVLGDRRGWTAEGAWSFQRVGEGQVPDFTVYVATPDTRDDLCGMGVDGYTSCRNGDNVVLNVARWAEGVPGYGAPLAQYREYMINHEVGHRLGLDHELCPGAGRPAPVMQQQTLGLQGCLPNSWPHPATG